jgi:uncharacterized protein (TIGR02217 family)
MFVEDPPFPVALAYGATGGPEYSTTVVLQGDGVERRNRGWAQARCRYDVGSTHRTRDEITVLLDFFRAVAVGRQNGFRFRDFTDSTFANPIGTGNGTTTTFQLVKRYQVGAWQSTRVLTKPVVGTLTLWLDSVEVVVYTIDWTTGLVTLPSPPAAGAVLEAQGAFEVPVRFNIDTLPIRRVAPDAYSCDAIELVEIRLQAE